MKDKDIDDSKTRSVKDWLQKKETVAEAEANNMVIDKRLGRQGVPFGFMNDRWNDFKALMIEGDELWYFNSDEYSWKLFHGRTGYAIVRDATVKYVMVTSLS
jgi:hypothetical protein